MDWRVLRNLSNDVLSHPSLSLIIFYTPVSPNVFISPRPRLVLNSQRLWLLFLQNMLFLFLPARCIGSRLVKIGKRFGSRVINPSFRIIIIFCYLREYWHLVYLGKSNVPETKWNEKVWLIWCSYSNAVRPNLFWSIKAHSKKDLLNINKLCRGAY